MYAYVTSYPQNYAIFNSADDIFWKLILHPKKLYYTIEMYDQFMMSHNRWV